MEEKERKNEIITQQNLSDELQEIENIFLEAQKIEQININKAIILYEKACKLGHAQATFELGRIAMENNENEKAVALFRLAGLERGWPKAINLLGIMYEEGKGIKGPPNIKTAVSLYRLSAEKGYVSAMYNLGVLYEEGSGVEKNIKEAMEWYRLAGEKGPDPDALNNLGCIIRRGGDGAGERDLDEASRIFRKGVLLDHLDSMCNLASMQLHNEGPQWNDTGNGLFLYTKAAKRGSLCAQKSLARIYEHGKFGVSKDILLAKRYYKMAAKQGDERAKQKLNEIK